MKTLRLLAFAAAAALLVSCAPTRVPKEDTGMGGIVTLPIKPSVYVRVTFDSNASNLIGSFFPDEADDVALDESQATRTRCSKFITPRSVPASGEVEEVFASNSSIGGSVGVKGIASLKGEHSTSNALRIRYNPSSKLMAEVDEDGLYKCCQQMPDQCTKRYLSQVIAGDGRIYVATEKANEAGLEASGTLKSLPIDGDVMYKDGLKWERKTNFASQYFAFMVQRALQARDVAASCEWTHKVPQSPDGAFFVGVSDAAPSERTARDQAMLNAREQLISFLGEYLTQESQSNERLAGALGAVQGELNSMDTVQRTSQGLSKTLKDQAWCQGEKREMPDGTYTAWKVLAFIPSAEIKNASRIQLTSVMEVLRQKGQLTPGRENALKAALAELGGTPAAGGKTATVSGSQPGDTRNAAGNLPGKSTNGVPEFEPTGKSPKSGAGTDVIKRAVEAGQQLLGGKKGPEKDEDGVKVPPKAPPAKDPGEGPAGKPPRKDL